VLAVRLVFGRHRFKNTWASECPKLTSTCGRHAVQADVCRWQTPSDLFCPAALRSPWSKHVNGHGGLVVVSTWRTPGEFLVGMRGCAFSDQGSHHAAMGFGIPGDRGRRTSRAANTSFTSPAQNRPSNRSANGKPLLGVTSLRGSLPKSQPRFFLANPAAFTGLDHRPESLRRSRVHPDRRPSSQRGKARCCA